MYLLLLVFGGVLTAAGIVLAAFGVSLRDHTFDTSIMTPGVVAAVGGLLLIGLGLTLRVLARIERALAAQPVRRAGPEFAAQPELAVVETPHPIQPRQTGPALPAAAVPVAATVEKPVPDAVEKSAPEMTPLVARLEASRAVAAADASRLADPPMPLPTSVDIAVAQVDRAQAAKRRNGAAAPRITPRLEVGVRSPAAAERPSGPSFDALWPKASRPGVRAPGTPAPVQSVETPIPEPQPAQAAPTLQAVPAPTPQAPLTAAATDAVSVLKSGVVDGMAYTLYSDGSIEAQLPQGMLRFGSITELRNHIEQSA
ncbi:MAG TPA: hypothetical protein VMC05_03600 [Xanthobacteraceae bacterium]|nr:hypothetical protein [Xanthobacteraceae bacterium]